MQRREILRQTISGAGGTFSFDSSDLVPSAPHALRVRTTASTDTVAAVLKTLPKFEHALTKVRLEFAFRIDSGDGVAPLSGVYFAGIIAGSKSTDPVVALELGSGPVLGVGWYDPTDSSTKDLNFETPFPAENEWLGRYALEITYTSSGSGSRSGCARAFVDGTPQMSSCLKLPAVLLDPRTLSVGLGVTSGGLGFNGDVQLRFDDFTVTAE